MERRRFFGILPLGLLGIAGVAQGQDAPQVKKSKAMILDGPNGEKYHPLVVSVNDETHESVDMPIIGNP